MVLNCITAHKSAAHKQLVIHTKSMLLNEQSSVQTDWSKHLWSCSLFVCLFVVSSEVESNYVEVESSSDSTDNWFFAINLSLLSHGIRKT